MVHLSPPPQKSGHWRFAWRQDCVIPSVREGLLPGKAPILPPCLPAGVCIPQQQTREGDGKAGDSHGTGIRALMTPPTSPTCLILWASGHFSQLCDAQLVWGWLFQSHRSRHGTHVCFVPDLLLIQVHGLRHRTFPRDSESRPTILPHGGRAVASALRSVRPSSSLTVSLVLQLPGRSVGAGEEEPCR